MSNWTITTTKSYFQLGVLSPLLRSLVIDKLPRDLDSQGYEVFGFADDIAIMFRDKVESVLSERMQTGKTEEIPFTRNRKHNLKNPVIRGVR
jgi:hypothetical protein